MTATAEGFPPAVSETHISTVFFSGDRAYKLLKPVRTSFLDHTSVEDRLAAAETEIALNRRLAPDVYLGSADVVEADEIVDRMIVMRRLPESRRLSAVVRSDVEGHWLRAVARTIAAFHASQPPAADGGDIADRDAVAKNWHDNFADLGRERGNVLDTAAFDRVELLVDRYLGHRQPLFSSRIAQGFIRDGHGDLTAEDIFCVGDGPKILDCLAFDRRLRVADVLADVAFLAMDLDRLAGADARRRFLRWYSEFSNEHHPGSLVHHYIAYRAHVRAKVAAIRHRQGDPTAAAMVSDYHALCLRHLEQSRVQLTLIGGPPGTGKTTLANRLSSPLRAMVLSTDDLRKDLAHQGHLEREFSAVDQGVYSPAMTDRTYAALLDQAAILLRLGQSVILDASWSAGRLRRQAAEVAEAVGAELLEVRCALPTPAATRRVAERLELGVDPSDVRPALVDELTARYEPWPTAIQVDTEHGVDHVVTTALDRLAARHGLALDDLCEQQRASRR